MGHLRCGRLARAPHLAFPGVAHGTRIRHRPPTAHVRPLTIAVVGSSFLARLVPRVGPGPRLLAAAHPASDPAVDLPPITTTADEEDGPATSARRLTQTL